MKTVLKILNFFRYTISTLLAIIAALFLVFANFIYDGWYFLFYKSLKKSEYEKNSN